MRRHSSTWLSTFTKLGLKKKRRRTPKANSQSPGRGFSRLLRAEALEDRRMLAILTVTSHLDDNGNGLTLREAIDSASSAQTDTIVFAQSLTGQTITLDQGALFITKSIIIDGGNRDITLAGNGSTRLFTIDDGNDSVHKNVTLRALTLTGGEGEIIGTRLTGGGAILSRENLTVHSSIVTGNSSGEGFSVLGRGGAIDATLNNGAALNIIDSVVSNNISRGGSGGGIYVSTDNTNVGGNEVINISGSTLSGNASSNGSGGGGFIQGGRGVSVTITDSIVTGNRANEGGGLRIGTTFRYIHQASLGATVNVQRTTISNNIANNRGGGLYLYGAAGATMTISESTVTGNEAGLQRLSSTGRNPTSGGGLYAYLFTGDKIGPLSNPVILPNPDTEITARLTIAGSTFDHNQAGRNGGGAMIFTKREDSNDTASGPRTQVGIYNSTFSTNDANMDHNGQFYPDLAGTGGGINIAFFTMTTANPVEGIDVRIHNATVTKNRAAQAGGIFAQAHDGNDVGDTVLNNSIVSGNTVYSGNAADGNNLKGGFDTAASFSNLLDDVLVDADPHNLITSTGTGPGHFVSSNGNRYNLSAPNDPLLNPLAYNGGRTRTHLPRYGSLAIDTGSQTWAVAPYTTAQLTVDQRGAGYTRSVNTTGIGYFGPGGVPWGPVDIGAVEYTGTYVVTTLSDGPVGTPPFPNFPNLSLRAALYFASVTPGPDTITFADNLFAGGSATISVGSALIVDSAVTIDGPSANVLSISGGGTTRVFQVNTGIAATLRGLTVKYGSAGTSNGGAITSAGNLTLDRVHLTQNTALIGGGLYASGGTLLVTNSTISNNTGYQYGGGIYLAGATNAQIVNSTISNNTTNIKGGGIYDASAPFGVNAPGAYIKNSTVVGNHANSGTGGGVFSSTNSRGSLLFNSIVAANTASNSDTRDLDGVFFSFSTGNLIGYDPNLQNGLNSNTNYFNLVGGENFGPAIDPKLTGLGMFGGTTPTHALLKDSPAIDAGNNSLADSTQPFDQRGPAFARIADGNGNGPKVVDIGAFEFSMPLPGTSIVVSTLEDELDDGNYAPGFLSIREALAMAAVSPDHDTIEFDGTLFGATQEELTLEHGQLSLTNVTIEGPGADLLAIDANLVSRIFQISPIYTVEVSGMTIRDGVNPLGAAIDTQGNLTLRGVAVEYNDGEFVGAIYAVGGTLNIIDSLVANNVASGAAGVYMTNVIAKIINSTISTNISSGGSTGGIDISGGSLELVNSTVTQNRGAVGGIRIYGSNVTAHNSIIAENYLTNGTTPSDVWGGLNQASSFNLFGRGGSGFLLNPRNPVETNGNIHMELPAYNGMTAKLSTLADHGGPMRTHRLLSNSLAIDRGDNTIAEAYDLAFDQRGFDRIVDWSGNGFGGDRIDIGAVELAINEIFP